MKKNISVIMVAVMLLTFTSAAMAEEPETEKEVSLIGNLIMKELERGEEEASKDFTIDLITDPIEGLDIVIRYQNVERNKYDYSMIVYHIDEMCNTIYSVEYDENGNIDDIEEYSMSRFLQKIF